MMVSEMTPLNAADLVHLPYTPDLTQAGLAYTCRALARSYEPAAVDYDRLRRSVAGVAVELALRRYLNEQGVPFESLGASPFTAPERYDLAFAGRRADLKTTLLLRKSRIRAVRRDPEYLLNAQALVPVEQLEREQEAVHEFFLFAFLAALVTPGWTELEKALAAGQPAYLIHALPGDWRRSPKRAALHPLALKVDGEHPLVVELGGLDAAGEFITETLHLPPHQSVTANSPFQGLAYLHTTHIPGGRLGVHSPALGRQVRLIEPNEWHNLWVYGLEVILAGYSTRRELRAEAQRLPAGSRVLQYERTRSENFALPVRALHPLDELCDLAKRWSRR